MKNLLGRRVESFRTHVGIRVGNMFRGKEVTTVTDEHARIEFGPNCLVATMRESGEEVFVPYTDIMQGKFLITEEEAANNVAELKAEKRKEDEERAKLAAAKKKSA